MLLKTIWGISDMYAYPMEVLMKRMGAACIRFSDAKWGKMASALVLN